MAVVRADFMIDGISPWIVIPEKRYQIGTVMYRQNLCCKREYVFNVVYYCGLCYLQSPKNKPDRRKVVVGVTPDSQAEPWFLIKGWEKAQSALISRPEIIARLHEDTIVFVPVRRDFTSPSLATGNTCVDFSYMDAADVEMVRLSIHGAMATLGVS